MHFIVFLFVFFVLDIALNDYDAFLELVKHSFILLEFKELDFFQNMRRHVFAVYKYKHENLGH